MRTKRINLEMMRSRSTQKLSEGSHEVAADLSRGRFGRNTETEKDMFSNRTCNTPQLKPRVEQAFALLDASFPIRRGRSDGCTCPTIAELCAALIAEANRCASNNFSPECKSQAPHSSIVMIETADRSSEPAQHGDRHRKQSGRARSPQSSKKPRR
jgi:hypothetical protein